LQPGQLARFANDRLKLFVKIAAPAGTTPAQSIPLSRRGAPDRRLFSGRLYHASPE
jgi:hypothetical protein